MRAEMGVMPWGKHVFYPRMLHKARPQKVSDFLVDDERWYLNGVRELDIEKWGEKYHLYRSASGKYYLGLLFKSTKARSVRRKISLGTLDEEVAKERREMFYEEWEGKHLTWPMYRDWETINPDRKSTRLNSSHSAKSRMPSSA